MPEKPYCYVDESGQDTQGQFFVVAVVVSDLEMGEGEILCTQIEEAVGKNRKWSKTPESNKIEYMRCILKETRFKGCLFYAVYREGKDYPWMALDAVMLALARLDAKDITVKIDGLSRHEEKPIGLQLRRAGFPTNKVRGVKKDENSAMVRLADAVCGLVREVEENRGEFVDLFNWGVKRGYLVNLRPD